MSDYNFWHEFIYMCLKESLSSAECSGGSSVHWDLRNDNSAMKCPFGLKALAFFSFD